MTRIRRLKFCGFIRPLGTAGVLAAAVSIAVLGGRAQNPVPPQGPPTGPSPVAVKELAAPPAAQHKGDDKESKLEKTKSDAAELSALADQIRDELSKVNVNVLPLDVIEKAEKVEQLARKIKEEARGH